MSREYHTHETRAISRDIAEDVDAIGCDRMVEESHWLAVSLAGEVT